MKVKMKKEEVVEEICNCFDYNYCIYNDGRIVMDDGLGIDHVSTTKIIGENFCGHLEYNSVEDMLLDWLEELKNGEDAQKVFAEEIKFIEAEILKM